MSQMTQLIMARRGFLVHLTTDPGCKRYTATTPGTTVDRMARGFLCPICAGTWPRVQR